MTCPGVNTGDKDLAFVREALACVMHKWYDIGLHWGIIADALDRIKESHRRDLEACFTDMIAQWLNNK